MSKINWEAHWLEIAEAYGTPARKRTQRQRELIGGLCHSLEYATSYNFNDSLEFSKLKNTVDIDCYWWPPTPAYNQVRSDFALLMWALGNDGFEDLLEYARGLK